MDKTSKAYAEAIFALACEKELENDYLEQLKHSELVINENAGFSDLLSCPGISVKQRTQMLDEVFSEDLHEHVLSFIKLLCEKGKLYILGECIKEYELLLRQRKLVAIAKVTSAIPLTKEQESALKAKLEKQSGKTVELEIVIDESIMGGIITELDGIITDGSLKHQLQEIKDVMNQ